MKRNQSRQIDQRAKGESKRKRKQKQKLSKGKSSGSLENLIIRKTSIPDK